MNVPCTEPITTSRPLAHAPATTPHPAALQRSNPAAQPITHPAALQVSRPTAQPSAHPANHLTDAQLDDLLLGEALPLLDDHLDSCAACAARLADADLSLAAYNTVTLAWAERRSATLPAALPTALHGSLPRPGLPFASLPLAARLSAAAAVCVALVAGVTNPSLQYLARTHAEAFAGQSATSQSATSATSSAADPDLDIARDNRMLSAVDRETGVDAASLAPALGLVPAELREPATRPPATSDSLVQQSL